jgi:hypothetical protein
MSIAPPRTSAALAYRSLTPLRFSAGLVLSSIATDVTELTTSCANVKIASRASAGVPG